MFSLRRSEGVATLFHEADIFHSIMRIIFQIFKCAVECKVDLDSREWPRSSVAGSATVRSWHSSVQFNINGGLTCYLFQLVK